MTAAALPWPRVAIGPLSISRVRASQLLDHVFGELARGRGGWLLTANLDFVQRATADAGVAALYDRADVVLADGTPLVWAAQLKGEPLPERLPGSDLVWRLAERAAAEGRSLYLLGGAGDAAARAAARLTARWPRLRIAGCASPRVSQPPAPEELGALGRDLAAARPDLVYVGLGSPKQERVIEALRAGLPACWWLGCGISLSFIAGDVRRAPLWMQRSGLEWIHRLLQEPRRLAGRYLLRNLPFAARLLAEARRSGRAAAG